MQLDQRASAYFDATSRRFGDWQLTFGGYVYQQGVQDYSTRLWQWIGIDAEPRTAYRTDAGGRLQAVTEPIAPFTVNNLGLQIRYRYEIGPLSELFLVYARGGFDLLRDDQRSVADLFGHMSDVRDADQFMIKMRYRL